MATNQRIRKSETAAASAVDDTFELSNIVVEEVSLVDRPANERQFLVKKNKVKRVKTATSAVETPVNDSEDLAAVGAAPAVENPAAALDAADAMKSISPAAALDAADAAKLGTAPAAVIPGTSITPAEKALTADQASSALDALAKDVKKTEVTVTPEADGSVTVAVDTTPDALPAAAPAEVIDAVKAAVVAGIDAIASRLAMFRAKVDSDTSGTSAWSMSGKPYLYEDIDYLTSMLYALCDVGGPQWEIEAAGDAAADVDKAQGVKKGHKAITGARVAKLHAVHKALSYCMKDFGGIMKELQNEEEEKADATSESTMQTEVGGFTEKNASTTPATVVASAVKAATVVAPVVPAPVSTPSIPASVQKDINDLSQSVASLAAIVQKQSQELNRKRDSVQESNAIRTKTDAPRDMIAWPADLAAPAARFSR